MDTPEARKILAALAAGADPETGEELPELRNNPRLADALYLAYIAMLKGAEPASESNEVVPRIGPSAPARAGTPWLQEDDEQLIRGRAAGRTLRELARDHQRTTLAIAARLQAKGFLINSAAALELLAALNKDEKGMPAADALTSAASRDAVRIGINAILKHRAELDSPRPPKRGSRAWTAEEDKILIAEYEAGTPPFGIACILNRTDGAVRSRLRRLHEKG